METFVVRKWLTGEVAFTAEIECAPNALPSIKLGLAAKWAFTNKPAALQGAYLRGADLRGADLRGADLRGADLQGAYLQGAYLQGAYLQGADLRGADLQGADLRGADLRGAYLRGAYLRGADLQGADLRGAALQGEKVTRLLATADRVLDGYSFFLFEMETGAAKITAGCRFMTIDEYREHVSGEYADTPKATATTLILDYFEAVEKANPKAEVAAPAEQAAA